MGIEVSSGDGVAEVVIDYPPVNALPVQGWFDLADALMAAGQDSEVRAVVLAANGRGFCAGVVRAIDIVQIALDTFGAPIYVRKEIVHNSFVVNELAEKGAIFVEDIDDVPEGMRVIY